MFGIVKKLRKPTEYSEKRNDHLKYQLEYVTKATLSEDFIVDNKTEVMLADYFEGQKRVKVMREELEKLVE